MKSVLVVIIVLLLVATVSAAALVWSGVYNVAANEPHGVVLDRLLAIARERSVAVRAAAITVPDLARPELIRRGAGNYDAMCENCHLHPGMATTELRRGLYPEPPELATRAAPDPARDFWIIKHGIKASGMPAWGRSVDDESLWGIVAFLRWLPGRSAADYEALVGASGGHSHDRGEEGREHEEP